MDLLLCLDGPGVAHLSLLDCGRRGINHYTSFSLVAIPIWLEYVQFSIGGMGEEDGVKKVRDVFDKALTHCGLHVSKGATLWEAYREFESAILAGLLVCLTLYLTTNFRLFQNERVCRQQFQI